MENGSINEQKAAFTGVDVMTKLGLWTDKIQQSVLDGAHNIANLGTVRMVYDMVWHGMMWHLGVWHELYDIA